MKECLMCEKDVEEVCLDGVCRTCHVSLTWDECVSGTYSARLLVKHGHPREEVLELYPNAKI